MSSWNRWHAGHWKSENTRTSTFAEAGPNEGDSTDLETVETRGPTDEEAGQQETSRTDAKSVAATKDFFMENGGNFQPMIGRKLFE